GARVVLGVEMADRDVDPDPVVLAARLEQQHRDVRIGRQAVREHAAGGPRPDDHVVEAADTVAVRHAITSPACTPTLARLPLAPNGAPSSAPRPRRTIARLRPLETPDRPARAALHAPLRTRPIDRQKRLGF